VVTDSTREPRYLKMKAVIDEIRTMFRCCSSNPAIKNNVFLHTRSTAGRGQTSLAINLVNASLGSSSLTPRTSNKNCSKRNILY